MSDDLWTMIVGADTGAASKRKRASGVRRQAINQALWVQDYDGDDHDMYRYELEGIGEASVHSAVQWNSINQTFDATGIWIWNALTYAPIHPRVGRGDGAATSKDQAMESAEEWVRQNAGGLGVGQLFSTYAPRGNRRYATEEADTDQSGEAGSSLDQVEVGDDDEAMWPWEIPGNRMIDASLREQVAASKEASGGRFYEGYTLNQRLVRFEIVQSEWGWRLFWGYHGQTQYTHPALRYSGPLYDGSMMIAKGGNEGPFGDFISVAEARLHAEEMMADMGGVTAIHGWFDKFASKQAALDPERAYQDGFAAYESGSPRLAPYAAPDSEVGGPESMAWRGLTENWLKGWDALNTAALGTKQAARVVHESDWSAPWGDGGRKQVWHVDVLGQGKGNVVVEMTFDWDESVKASKWEVYAMPIGGLVASGSAPTASGAMLACVEAAKKWVTSLTVEQYERETAAGRAAYSTRKTSSESFGLVDRETGEYLRDTHAWGVNVTSSEDNAGRFNRPTAESLLESVQGLMGGEWEIVSFATRKTASRGTLILTKDVDAMEYFDGYEDTISLSPGEYEVLSYDGAEPGAGIFFPSVTVEGTTHDSVIEVVLDGSKGVEYRTATRKTASDMVKIRDLKHNDVVRESWGHAVIESAEPLDGGLYEVTYHNPSGHVFPPTAVSGDVTVRVLTGPALDRFWERMESLG